MRLRRMKPMIDQPSLISHQELKRIVAYNPETGVFTARVRRSRVVVGMEIGSPTSNGYTQITLWRRNYGAHRLAWFYMTGKWPVLVDHKDRDGHNNRWSNLREANHIQNGQNRKGTTPLKGACWHKPSGKWFSLIRVNRKRIWLGAFDTAASAHAAYILAAEKYFGEFARAA